MLAEFLLQGMCIATLRLWMQQLVGFNDVNHHFQCCKKHHFSCRKNHHFSWVILHHFLALWLQAQQRPALCVVKALVRWLVRRTFVPWVATPVVFVTRLLNAKTCHDGLWGESIRYTYGTRILGDEHP